MALLRSMRERIGVLGCAFVLLLLPALAPAQTGTPSLVITGLTTGWNADQFRVETSQQAITNPAGCQSPDGYISEFTTNPGHKTHYAAVMLAIVSGKTLSLVVHNTECVAARPKIIGVSVR